MLKVDFTQPIYIEQPDGFVLARVDGDNEYKGLVYIHREDGLPLAYDNGMGEPFNAQTTTGYSINILNYDHERARTDMAWKYLQLFNLEDIPHRLKPLSELELKPFEELGIF